MTAGNSRSAQEVILPIAIMLVCILCALIFRTARKRPSAFVWPGPTSNGLPRGKMYFRPSEAWQEVLPEHVLPNGLELRMDFDTGRNYARLMPGQVDTARNQGDEAVVSKHLLDAATWNKPDCMRQVIGSCYWHGDMLTLPLCEVAERGHMDVCQVLLRANADPLGHASPLRGATALHRACGEGHEDIAMMLLRKSLELGRRDALQVLDDLGRSCLDIAREQDLGPAARRIEAAFHDCSERSAVPD